MGSDDLFRKRKAALERKVREREQRRILIVCEGEKTEPNYFKSFPENPEVFDALDIRGKEQLPCHRQNPVTTVFQLVERLNGD